MPPRGYGFFKYGSEVTRPERTEFRVFRGLGDVARALTHPRRTECGWSWRRVGRSSAAVGARQFGFEQRKPARRATTCLTSAGKSSTRVTSEIVMRLATEVSLSRGSGELRAYVSSCPSMMMSTLSSILSQNARLNRTRRPGIRDRFPAAISARLDS